MNKKCNYPKEVLKKCSLGAKNVNLNDSNWETGIKIFKRNGKKINSEWGCSKIPKECC